MGADTTEKRAVSDCLKRDADLEREQRTCSNIPTGRPFPARLFLLFWLHRSLSRDDCGLRGGWLYHGRDCVLDFGIYVFGGLLGAIMSLYYKMPISGAFSIPGATLMGTALAGYSFQEAAGAFVIAGVIVLLLGVTGLIGKVMRWLPLPIVMGMIGGCMLKFGTQIVTGINTLPIVCGLAVLAFLLVPRVIKGFPGVLAALVVGVIAAIVTNSFAGEVGELVYTPPMLVVPQFNPNLILSCSLPLAALVVGAENAQAMGVLKAQGYNVPANAMTVASGIGGIISGLVGAHNANIAGPMTAICASEEAGPKEGRYAASFWNGVTFAAFGLVGSFTIAFVSFIPSELVNVLAGLAMLNVLIQAFNEGFGTLKYKTGAFFALCVGASGLSFWGLVQLSGHWWRAWLSLQYVTGKTLRRIRRWLNRPVEPQVYLSIGILEKGQHADTTSCSTETSGGNGTLRRKTPYETVYSLPYCSASG